MGEMEYTEEEKEKALNDIKRAAALKGVIAKILNGDSVEAGIFVECDVCLGTGSYPTLTKGGPYGSDKNSLTSCNTCHNRTGKKLVKIDLVGFVKFIVAMRDGKETQE